MDMSFPNEPYRGLGHHRPHLMPMFGQWICFKLNGLGRISEIGSGRTSTDAYKDMDANAQSHR